MLIAAAAEVSRKIQDRIDDQFARPVISANGESGAVRTAEHETPLHPALLAANFLIHLRSFQSDVPAPAPDYERSVFHLNLTGAVELQFRLRWIGAGRYLKVIFQLALVAVKDQIDAGVDLLILDSRKLGNAGPPFRRIVAHEVVAVSRQRLGAGKLGVTMRARQLHLQILDLGCLRNLRLLLRILVPLMSNEA